MPHREFWSRNLSARAQREIAAAAAALGVDARAVNILYNAFYDEDDKLLPWVGALDAPKKDVAFARAAGLMLDPIRLDHDELIAWVLEARAKVKPLAAANAFIASLGSRRLDTRSALGSCAHAMHLAPHRFEKDPDSDECAQCGVPKGPKTVNLAARNFRRLKWAGNVEQGDLQYVGCDLHQFAKLPSVTPSADEVAILASIFKAIRKLPKTAKLSELNQALAGLFKSTKQERQVVLEILGSAGILKPKGWPSLLDAWVRPADRTGPGKPAMEWQFPCCGWSGKDGVDDAAVRFWFPQLR